jgi:serine protease Do
MSSFVYFIWKKFKFLMYLMLIVSVFLIFVYQGYSYMQNNKDNFAWKFINLAYVNIQKIIGFSYDFNDANLFDNVKKYNKKITINNGIGDLVDHVIPSVVSINAVKVFKPKMLDLPEETDPIFKDFFKKLMEEQKDRKDILLGSGYVVRSDGLIVTNYHVIDGVQDIKVVMYDGKKYNAEIFAGDPDTDIAVLKITDKNVEKLLTMPFADSDKVKVGDFVLAIGNPFGFQGTVSLGIVSARKRDIEVSGYNDFIQTDAAINSGNSGGPMINMKGEVVGTNTAIYSFKGGGSIGIGFAIPSNIVKDIVTQLVLNKKVIRGWLGVNIQPITPEISELMGIDSSINGALVAGVQHNSPAFFSGLKSGDVIVAVDNKYIDNYKDVFKIIGFSSPNDTVLFKILRNKIETDIEVKLSPKQDNTLNNNQKNHKIKEPRLQGFTIKELVVNEIGIKVSDINDNITKMFGIKKQGKIGVAITAVKNNSIAAKKGIKAGIKIISINNREIESIMQLKEVVESDKSKGFLILFEMLNGDRRYLTFMPNEIGK